MIPILAGVCGTMGSLPSGPVQASLLPGALGNSRTPCIRSEVSVGGGGSAVIDNPDFYGRIQLQGSLEAHVALAEHTEIFTRLEGFRSDQVIAPLSVSESGIGAMAFGFASILDKGENHTVTGHGQLVTSAFPTQNARPLGFDVGLTGISGMPWGDIHGGATLYAETLLGDGPSAERAGLGGRFGMTRRLNARSLAVVLDVPVSFGWTGGLDHLGMALAIRWGTGKASRGFFGEFGVLAPLFGNDRTLASADLRVGVRFR